MKSKKYVVFFGLTILLVLIKGYLFSIKYTADDYEKEYTVFIEKLKSKGDTKVAYNVRLLSTKDKFILNIYDNSYDNIYTDLSQYANYTYGDVIKVKAKISIPQKLNNPGEFDYKLYLYSNNIHGLINTYEIPEKIDYNINIIDNIYSKIYVFKSYVQNIIKSSMNETNAELAMAMIYGDTTQLDEFIKEDFKTIGVSHLMSVSGTHITSFMLIINLTLGIKKKQSKRKERAKAKQKSKALKIIKAIIQILSILLYVTFTGFSTSVMRAAIMLIIATLCDTLNLDKNKYKALAITILVILLSTPYALFNTGTILSFLATLGIIMFNKHIVKLFNKLTNSIKNEVVKKVLKFITDNIAITIAVQLMIIPIQIQTFNRLPFPVIIPNLILGIISIPIRVIGTIGIMLSFIPKIATLLFKVTEIFVSILIYTSKVFKHFSFSITTASMPVIFFILYYLFVLGIFVYFKLKNIQSNIQANISKSSQNKEEKNNLNKLLRYIKFFEITLAIFLIVFVISLNIYSIYFSEYVYFFNVEQGDMSYVKCGKASVIVDIGSLKNNLAFNTISNYFKVSNLSQVDAVLISHMHKDHVNGLEQLLQNYKVGMIIYSKPRKDSKAFKDFKTLLEKYNVVSKEVKAVDRINIGRIEIQVLFPGNEYIVSDDEENANSLVCKITVNNNTLLYMGDASKDTEEKIIEEYARNKEGKNKSKKNTKLNIQIDDIYILKVGHHGSKSATSNEFIQKIQPQNAVISALKKYYGHPHENTLDTLKQNNVYTYLTEKQGAIKFSLK